MGKLIETTYSDIKHQILKKTKRDKGKQEILKCNTLSKKKRKLLCIQDNEPLIKKCKISNEDKKLGTTENDFKIDNIFQNEIIVNNVSVQKGYLFGNLYLTLQNDEISDLFLEDELKNSHLTFVFDDFYTRIVEEISLEGLDGITIEDFWSRLSNSVDVPIFINDNMKEIIWSIVQKNKSFEFFKLPSPRPELKVHNRYKYLDPGLGVVMEMAVKIPDVYPYEAVIHEDVQGSCSTFYTREDVTEVVREMCLTEVLKKYGRELVIVANQYLRRATLFHDTADPVLEIQNVEYCILERIARSRKQGELTQGNTSINTALKMDSQTLFHYVKKMDHCNLVAKQFFFIKSVITEQNKMGRLLHLKRFYTKIKHKQLIIAEKIINVLKRMPGYRMDNSKIKSMFAANAGLISKIMKSNEFRRYVKTDSFYEYRAIYPDAKKSEYMKKNVPVEKLVRCFELIDPHANVTANWFNVQEESDDEDEEDKEEVLSGCKIYNMELLKEIYYHIFNSGKRGLNLPDIIKIMGIDHSVVRTALRKLVDRDVVDVNMSDKGKQRTIKYYAKCLDNPDQIVDHISDDEQKPVKAVSKYKAMILEKQKTAIETRNLEQSREPEKDKLVKEQVKYQKIMDLAPINVPNCDCYFLLKHYQSWDDIFTDYHRAEFLDTFNEKLLKLSHKTLNTEELIEFNAILNELTTKITTPVVETNYNNYLSDKTNVNYMTKLILLKACFNEIVINNESLSVSRKRKLSSQTIPALENDEDKLRGYSEKLDYMGDNPRVVFHEVDNDIDTEIIESTVPEEVRLNKIYPKQNALTQRIASRIQKVLDTVNEKKIFEDSFRMLNLIHKAELQEGYVEKIDRKSLARILKKLVDEGYIKIFKLNIHNNVSKKTLLFICHPSVHYTNSIIENARQNIRWKYFIASERKSIQPYVPNVQKKIEEKMKNTFQTSPFKEADVMDSISELREMNKIKIKEMNSKYSRRAARLYGYKPKFIRMRVLHEFLFYVIYESNASTPLMDDEVRDLFKSYCIDVPEEMLEKIPKIYCKEISWKMFIPPLPEHKGWASGWALICDIILRLPVSVFCKVHNCSYEFTELSDVMNHPIERFYLVKDLPQVVRNAILYKRKYIFNIQDALSRLAFCGLIQYGPQKYREKDQVFIYLNRLVSLLDTTISEPAYHKVSKKEYRTLRFTLNTMADVDSYWCNVYAISLNTKLNTRAPGQLITYIDPSAKPELMKSLVSKTPEEALLDDNGDIPGDQRGAAGLDSSLWCHISRNWFWANRGSKPGQEPTTEHLGLTREKLEKLKHETPFANLNKVANKVYLHKRTKEQDVAKKRVLNQHPNITRTSKTVQRITKRLLIRSKKNKKRQYYDQTDKNILKKIGLKMRVKWSSEEDQILLLCKAGDLLLHKKKCIKQIIPYHVLRDLLHRVYPKSRNKTSRACQRRLKVLLKEHSADLEDGVPNLMSITDIRTYYSALLEKISNGFDANADKPFKLTDQQLIAAFVILMSYMLRNQYEIESVLQGNLYKDDHLSSKNLEYVEKNVTDVEDSLMKYFDPVTEEDIKKDVIKSVVLCSLACQNQPDWAAQLYKIYEKYPNIMIRIAVEEMKAAQIISCRKIHKKKEKFIGQIPFKLSQYYVFVQYTTFHSTSALEAYKSFLYMMEGDNNKVLDFSHETIESKKYGQMLGINEFACFWDKMDYKFHLPQSTVILNPEVKDHSELLEELAIRWQLKMKKIQQETEQESETETYRSKDSDTTILPDSIQSKSADLIDPDNTLDLTIDNTNSKTIDRLKTWVTDCMDREKERRSPSPEFMNLEMEMKIDGDNVVVPTENPESNNIEVDIKVYEDSQRKFNKGIIPTLEEIKTGMMEVTASNEDRRIPYVTDLSDLLNRENFSELSTSEEILEQLKKHFVTQYALLESISIDGMDELNQIHIVKYLLDHLGKQKVWEKVKDDMIVKEVFTTYNISTIITEEGGNQGDVDITNEIIEFVKSQKCFGVTAQELKEKYISRERNLSLKTIVAALVQNRIFLRTGIRTITFVYFKFQMIWLIETVVLSSAEQQRLQATNSDDDGEEIIEKQFRGKKQIHVKVMPWTKVDGSLNRETFQIWLCNIMSHCLDYPKIGLPKLCEKFRFIKPVDIYYLLEILQELRCVKMYVNIPERQTLFSKWEPVHQGPATFLDDFQHIIIEPNNVSMLCLGSFFYQVI